MRENRGEIEEEERKYIGIREKKKRGKIEEKEAKEGQTYESERKERNVKGKTKKTENN